MKIYLAARFSRLDEMRKYADELKEDGHEITSSWNYGGEEGLTFTDIALLDVRDVLSADAVVSFTEPYGSSNVGGGRHVEFGVALAAKKKLFIVGEREQVFHWWPTIVQFPQFKHLRNHLCKTLTNTNEKSEGSPLTSLPVTPGLTESLAS
jgi:hypothetical protein